jgi:hypothetical protein
MITPAFENNRHGGKAIGAVDLDARDDIVTDDMGIEIARKTGSDAKQCMVTRNIVQADKDRSEGHAVLLSGVRPQHVAALNEDH